MNFTRRAANGGALAPCMLQGSSMVVLRHTHYEMRRVNHSIAYAIKGACTNLAESFISRLRRSEIGIHHHISGPYLSRFASEMAWREDHRRKSTDGQFEHVATRAMGSRKSNSFTGYWQRAA